MTLKELMNVLEIIEYKGEIEREVEISNIVSNSKNSTPNSIFVAIKGYETDGHKYVEAAYEKGAVLAVVEDFVEVNIPQVKVKNTRDALADLSAKFFNYPSKELNVIGITATNGKTTTSFMVDYIFRNSGIVTGLIGTVEVKYKDVIIPSVLTTPESRDLQEYVRNMADEGVTDLIMEVSSHAQELSRIKNMDYDIVTFNNFAREHIDQHGSVENYYKYKSRLIKNAKAEAWAVLNFDDEMIKPLAKETQARVLGYSIENNMANFGMENLDLSTGLASFDFTINIDIPKLNLQKSRFKVELGIAGFSGVMNSMVAIIISLIKGISIPNIQKYLKEFPGVERRFQMIYNREYKVIDDHYANAKNINVTMSTIEKMSYEKIHMVYAIRGCRGLQVNKEAAEETAKWLKTLGVKHIISTSSIETVTWKDVVTDEEKDIFMSIMEDNSIDVEHFDRLDDAVYKSLEEVKDGDLLLLAGCQGMDAGGRYLIEKIASEKSGSEKDEILKVLDGRVC